MNLLTVIVLLAMLIWANSLSPLGSVVGLVWAFFDGLIGGAIFAWLYNLLASALPMGKASSLKRAPR